MIRAGLQSRLKEAREACRRGYDVLTHRGPSQMQFWFLALVIGIGSGFAALFFKLGILALQGFFYGTSDATLTTVVGGLPWWIVLGTPVLGGLIVGFILTRFTPDGRSRSVADVIEGAALNEGRVEGKAGLASAAASLITLSTGGSTGREGPVVHIAGMISTWVSDRIQASGMTARDLLGCAVAAAVSALFNAPIAGALFALEVVLRHFAVHAFAPIVVAAAAGTVINRLAFGDLTEFTIPAQGALEFYIELPAFLILGLLSGIMAAALMRSIFFADDMGTVVQTRFGLPNWLRPGIAGFMLGVIALGYPHIIGVGYEVTSQALTGSLGLREVVVFAIFKVIAVAITMGGRMGGGVFSPALMVGALTGLGFGIVATGLFPTVSGSATLYALAGMGAVAAAVLGAPISTTLIVFELTGDWQIGLAVMVAVSTSTALASRLVDRSFFLTQLERRGVHLAAGPQAYLLALYPVQTVMRATGAEGCADEATSWEMIEAGVYIDGNATLEAAMPIFETTNAEFIPVVTLGGGEGVPPKLWGALFQVDALRAMNRALSDTAREEHS